jgi:DNA-binding MarR family transcriptional regulator
MGMQDEPSAAEVMAWARLMRAQRRLLAAVEGDLKRAGLPPLAWYDVLLELARAGEPLRPVALEARLLLAQHNVSRLLDRMEAAGLVLRAPCADDGRGQIVEISQAGHAMQRKMWSVYGPAIRRHLGERLGDEVNVAALADLLKALVD